MLSAAVRLNGSLVPSQADLPPNAIFPIYSITKTLTAICVLRLVEAGALTLDASARAWLPEVGVPESITLRHLLRHTSGLRDYGPLPQYHAAVRACPQQPWTRQQFLDATLPAGLLFSPGEGFSYSNIGYMLLIDIVGRVTGRTFGQTIDTCIVRPLALLRTSAAETIDDLMRCAPGFGSEVTFDGTAVDVRGRDHPGWCAPRLVTSTAADISQIFDTMIAGTLLLPETLTEMLTLVPLSMAAGETQGAGLGVYSDSAWRWAHNDHHGGGGPGYNTWASVLPATKRGRVAVAAFATSSATPSALDCQMELLDRVLAEPQVALLFQFSGFRHWSSTKSPAPMKTW
jgi:D-alanyl-D-alanine carboxypeptidase